MTLFPLYFIRIHAHKGHIKGLVWVCVCVCGQFVKKGFFHLTCFLILVGILKQQLELEKVFLLLLIFQRFSAIFLKNFQYSCKRCFISKGMPLLFCFSVLYFLNIWNCLGAGWGSTEHLRSFTYVGVYWKQN